VADVIATDGGADSRDFLTKVQVFSFSLKRPRPSRNTVPVSRLSRVFRVFPPRSSNASGYGCRARFGFRARVLTTIDNRQVSHASRSTSCAFIALRKRISRCERERERERERQGRTEERKCQTRASDSRIYDANTGISCGEEYLLEFDSATLDARLSVSHRCSIFSNAALASPFQRN